MRRNKNRILWVLMTVVLIIGLFSTFALAVDPVDPSDTLDVYLKTSAGTTLLHTYELAEMQALAKGKKIEYSSIDNMPATVYTIATGVYIEDLLNDVKKKYTEMDVQDFSRLRLKATDGAIGNFTYDDLFEDRYYYPGLHEDGHGLNEDQEIDYEVGEGTFVKPMLAIEAWQTRKPMPGEYRDPYEPERYTILFGMSEKELEKVKKRTSDYKRGIYELTIDMGDVSPPTTGEVAVTGIDLESSAAEITVGKKLQLNATINPDNATNQGVKWATSDDSVATVSSGLVTGIAAGTVTITATADGDAAISKTCTITVSAQSDPGGGSRSGSGSGSDSVSVSNIVLSNSQLTLAVGKEKTLTATVSPANASDRDVTWKSSNTGIATVDQNGVVKGVKEGSATITATAGGRSATCSVTVVDTDVPVDGVKLNDSSLTLGKGNSSQIKAVISPAAATNTTVFWSSDAPGVVSVDTEGLITAQNIGSAVITVMTEDGSFTAQCTITVSDTASSFGDISDNWAKKDIESMVSLGFITGYDDGTFRPGSTITRAEFLSILIRVLEKTQNIQLKSDNTFPDTAGHWAKDYISTAVKLDITTGYGDTKFGPNDKITREQIAVMLAAAAGYDQNQPAVSFSDSRLIAGWAVPAVSYTVNEGFFTGYEDGSFGPKKNATRAEVSALLMRFYEKMTGINN